MGRCKCFSIPVANKVLRARAACDATRVERDNQNPFTFGKDVPIQNPFASYDPFAALNVPQAVPKSDADLLANLLREHIYG